MHKKRLKKPSQRSSEILMEMAQDKKLDGDLTYRYILEALGERAFGIGILFFSLPIFLPFSTLPGLALVFSLPIVFFALEMILARKSFWLTKSMGNKTISHSKFSKIIHAVAPYLIKLERLSKPRLAFMTSRPMEVINGIVILFLTLLLVLPIPFSNSIFGAFLVSFGLGMAEKDGVLILIGHLLFALYVSFMYFYIFKFFYNLLFV